MAGRYIEFQAFQRCMMAGCDAVLPYGARNMLKHLKAHHRALFKKVPKVKGREKVRDGQGRFV